MREAFWPENKDRTFAFFAKLPQNQVFYFDTTFDGFEQLEMFVEMMYILNHKEFTFNIMHGSLADGFYEFYEQKQSSITPKALYDVLNYIEDHQTSIEVMEEIYEFKKTMNRKFLEVLQAHTVRWISWGHDIVFKTLDDIEKHRYEK